MLLKLKLKHTQNSCVGSVVDVGICVYIPQQHTNRAQAAAVASVERTIGTGRLRAAAVIR